MEVEEHTVPLIIGYYPFRAKAQIIRLLCEYLKVPYYDRFLNPDEWSRFKEGDGKHWLNKQLPFLKHGDFILTGCNAMVNYVIEVSGRTELLGKTLEHKAKIDIFRSRGCLNILLGFLCNGRLEADQLKFERRKQLNELYERKIQYLLHLHEQECLQEDFYFGYITLIDFAIYQIMNYFRLLFPREVCHFPKLLKIRDRVASLSEIQSYETSHRAIVDYCPIRYFKRFKEGQSWLRRERSESAQTQQASIDLEQNRG